MSTTVTTLRGSTSTSAKKCARQTVFERSHKGLCRKFEKPALGTRAKKLTRLTTPDCYYQGVLHLQSIAQQTCYSSVSVGKNVLPATKSKKETTIRSTSCKAARVTAQPCVRKNLHKGNTSQTGKCIFEHTSDQNRFAQQLKPQAGRGISRR